MRFRALRRAIGSVAQALPGGTSKAGRAVYGATGLGVTGSSMDMLEREKAANLNTADVVMQQNAKIAEEQRQKALAEESVRQQEEKARRRTIFGGAAIDEAQQRKTLLGL